jgi:hypothetical protein
MKFRMTAGLAGIVAVLGTGCGTLKEAPALAGPAAAPAAVAAPAAAKPPVRFVRRPHLQFKNEADLGEYLALEGRKRSGLENFRALTRLLQEKALEVQALNATLQTEFRYSPDNRYDYDSPNKVLSMLESDGKGGVVKKEVMKLTAESETRFTALLEQRKALLNEAGSIHSAGNRAKAELDEIVTTLLKDYAESRDREYELDPRTRMLIEKVPVPARFELEGN